MFGILKFAPLPKSAHSIGVLAPIHHYKYLWACPWRETGSNVNSASASSLPALTTARCSGHREGGGQT